MVARWKPAVAVILDHQNAWHWVKKKTPRTKLLGRLYQPSEPDFNRPDLNPRAAARQHCRTLLPVARQMAGVYDYWLGVNEPVLASYEAMQRFAAFEVERVNVLARLGFKAAIGSFSVGNPGDMSYLRAFLPAMEAARAHNGILSLHQYGWPTMETAAPWLSLRHRKVYEGEPSHGWPGLPEHLRLPLVITETGLDGGIQTAGWKQGWNGHIEPHEYREQLRRYDRELRKDKYILGAAIFCCGNVSADWSSFEIWPDVARSLAENADPLYRDPDLGDAQLTTQARGPDVSWWQGSSVDWRLAALGGVTFAYLRASVRLKPDSTYTRNHHEAGKWDILRGGYHYLYPEQSAAEQAQVFAAALLEGELPPVVDVEQHGLTEAHVQEFLTEFKAQTGIKAGIYTSRYRWHSLIGTQAHWAIDHPLWVADWRDREEPALPRPWKQWEFWQHTNQGRIDGYPKRVDMNVFRGTVAEIRAKYGPASNGSNGKG
jgi:GH25 family lysozyme M1 (1,4-beta-N-acetylmuramidase)